MLSFILMAVIITLYSLQTLFCVGYTKNYPGKPELASPVFCILESLSITVVSLAFIGFNFHPSPVTWLIGALNAFAAWGYNVSLIKASAKGSYAFVNVALLFGGVMLPILYNVFFLGNSMTALQIVAIIAMFGAFVLMNYEEISLKNTPFVYYVFCFILMIANGMYDTFLKIQDVKCPDESRQMVIITFAFMGIISFVSLLAKEKGDTLKAFRFNKKSVIPLVACLVTAALAINVLVLVIPLLDVGVLFTCESGGILVLSALYSFFIFKEKPTKLKIIGTIVATASIVALSV